MERFFFNWTLKGKGDIYGTSCIFWFVRYVHKVFFITVFPYYFDIILYFIIWYKRTSKSQRKTVIKNAVNIFHKTKYTSRAINVPLLYKRSIEKKSFHSKNKPLSLLTFWINCYLSLLAKRYKNDYITMVTFLCFNVFSCFFLVQIIVYTLKNIQSKNYPIFYCQYLFNIAIFK